MLDANLKLGMAVVAGIFAIGVLIADANIAQGTGLIVATLAAGAGWLVRDVIDAHRTLVTICQAYAALIEAHFEEISDSLSDAEIDRIQALSPAIFAGTEAESLGSRAVDPFASLPDIRTHLHLLAPDTVRYLWKWRARGTDLFLIYDQLGTKAMSATGAVRLSAHYAWVKHYRDEYRDIGYTALKCLAHDAPAVKINYRLHEHAGAKHIQ